MSQRDLPVEPGSGGSPEPARRRAPAVPPVEVSRPLLAAFVAAGALASVVTEGTLSSFAGGFAAGAGSAFVVSLLKSPRRGAGADPEAP